MARTAVGVGRPLLHLSICRDGKVFAHATYPVGYAIDGNSCLRFESVDHPGILDWITEFVADIGSPGTSVSTSTTTPTSVC